MKLRIISSRYTYMILFMLALGSCQSPEPAQEPTSMPSPSPTTNPTPLDDFHVTFADSEWDGKVVPTVQRCVGLGGQNPSTPPLVAKNIPNGSNAIILEYSDRDYSPMDDGGHGKVGFTISEGTEQAPIPSIPSNTFNLPENFFLVQEHKQGTRFEPGAYMPPCSGGRGNSYYVTAKAVERISMDELTFNVLEESILELGEY